MATEVDQAIHNVIEHLESEIQGFPHDAYIEVLEGLSAEIESRLESDE